MKLLIHDIKKITSTRLGFSPHKHTREANLPFSTCADATVVPHLLMYVENISNGAYVCRHQSVRLLNHESLERGVPHPKVEKKRTVKLGQKL